MNKVYSALKDLFNTDNDFKNAIEGRFQYGTGKSSWKKVDYAVCVGLPSLPDDTFDTDIEDVSFSINNYSYNIGRCEANRDKAEDLFHRATLTIPGYQDLKLHRVLMTPAVPDGDKGVFLSSIQFEGRFIKQ